jgi:hypothetical protein
MSATALKSTKRRFSSLNHQNFEFFRLVPRSPTHTGLICEKPWSRISQAWAPLRPKIQSAMLFFTVVFLKKKEIQSFRRWTFRGRTFRERTFCRWLCQLMWSVGWKSIRSENNVVVFSWLAPFFKNFYLLYVVLL